MFPGAKLPYGFKTFDFFERRNGVAISAKTLDTNTIARINKPELVRYQINGYINKMVDFTEDRFERLPTREMITSMELHLGIPANTSKVHMQHTMHSVNYGAMNGVKVVITKVK